MNVQQGTIQCSGGKNKGRIRYILHRIIPTITITTTIASITPHITPVNLKTDINWKHSLLDVLKKGWSQLL